MDVLFLLVRELVHERPDLGLEGVHCYFKLVSIIGRSFSDCLVVYLEEGTEAGCYSTFIATFFIILTFVEIANAVRKPRCRDQAL
jgi:uncharacterized membrane protein YjjP (DUF1212 family)